ncbi:MAG: ABC transporter permease [Bacteroidota bacterium]
MQGKEKEYIQPPKLAHQFLRFFLKEELLEEVEGDLEEKFWTRLEEKSSRRARLSYWYEVSQYVRPFAIKQLDFFPRQTIMLKHYLLINWRNLLKNRGYSFINIGGLGLGIAVAMLIGLWIYDELTFNTYHDNYDEIGWLHQHRVYGDETETWMNMPFATGEELRTTYGNHFSQVVSGTWAWEHILRVDEDVFMATGSFMEADAPDLFGLELTSGRIDALSDPSSIIVSESLAKKIFGLDDPMGERILIGATTELRVAGVYKDIPESSNFNELLFIAPWEAYFTSYSWARNVRNTWGVNACQIYVKLAKGTTPEIASAAVKDMLIGKLEEAGDEVSLNLQPEVFVYPMRKWHLYGNFENGVITGGRITNVWLFGIISFFVLLLACINFMNLSTARSEKRVREVGIRKAIGSQQYQLIQQFFTESILVAFLGFLLALGLVALALPWFNEIADKNMILPFHQPLFWLSGIGFTLITGLLAGSYPALYLSSFKSINALKGSIRRGRASTLPRKVLVVLQFTVSITLIIGTAIVYNQISYGQNREVGYDQAGLIYSRTILNDDIGAKLDVFEQMLQNKGAIEAMSVTENPITEIWSSSSGLSWKGKDPNLREEVSLMHVDHDFGETINWKITEGRDFSSAYATDSTAYIINQAAADLMGFENPVGEVIGAWGREMTVIGVVDNMVVQSPYSSFHPVLYGIIDFTGNYLHFKLAEGRHPSESIALIEDSWSEIYPGIPFLYEFVDKAYATKFRSEQRIMKLAGIFAMLAIFISCLGLFALAAFVAEKRTKEIGIRKILGASVSNIWRILSADFVILVAISCFFAIPLTFYYLSGWLDNFDYRVSVSLWVYVGACLAALGLTLLTVSIQTVKAAHSDPVNSLRYE